MFGLPADILKFGFWWLSDGPFKLARIFGRILALVNNEASFLLNLRMLLVPLFGDYTLIGRLMGFIYRSVKIVLGLVLIVTIFVFSIIVLFAWYVIPFYFLFEARALVLPLIFSLFVFWKFLTVNKPTRKIIQTSEHNYISSFRPECVSYIKLLVKNESTHFKRFFTNKDVLDLAFRLELNDSSFAEDYITTEADLTNLAKASYDNAKTMGSRYVEVEHLFLGLLNVLPDKEKFLSRYNLNYDTCFGAVAWVVTERDRLDSVFFWQDDYKVPVIGGINRAMTGRVTPALDAVGTDFTEQAKLGLIKNIHGHKKETAEIIDILGSSDKINVLIVGAPGSGKTSIVKGIALEIIKGTTDNALQFKRIVSIETSDLIAGASTAGDFAAKLKRIMDDVAGSKNIILFFDEIHNLVAADAKGGSTIFSLLEPYVASGNFQIIGATNIENFRKYVEPNGSFSRLFNIVEIGETNPEETLDIIEGAAFNFEKDYGVKVSYVSLQKTIDLSKKLIHERVFPDKALDILGRTATRIRKTKRLLTSADVSQVISEMTHVPVTAVNESESKKLLNIEAELKKRVIGQDHAIDQIGKAMKRGRVGIRSETKPIASFLFVGTTGVGKTETAKALASYYFGNPKAMIRLDMSEYQQQDSLSRLIGAPDGSSKGLLTEAVRKNPFSLILLDEIEKANPQVLLSFLQVLDDGRLTDSSGTVVDFTNSIIISTSNVGTRAIQEASEKHADFNTINDVALKEVRIHFAPEFLNRFSGLIVYKPLEMEDLKKIVIIMLNKVQRMSEEKGVRVSFKPEIIDELLKRGFSREWGARPLARAIEDSIETFIAIKLLSGDLTKGDEVVLGREVFDDTK